MLLCLIFGKKKKKIIINAKEMNIIMVIRKMEDGKGC